MIPSSTRNSDRSRRFATAVIFATIFLDFAGFSILIPVLPAVLGDMGANSVQIAITLALYVIALVIFLPVWGWISDRIGRRPVLLICLLGTASSFAMMSLWPSLHLYYAARALGGFFGASVGTAQAYMADITHAGERTDGLGLIGAASASGVIFGPAIGGLLLEIDPTLPFYAPVVLALLAFIAAAWFLPESRIPDKTSWRGLAQALVPTPLLVIFGRQDRSTRLFLYLFLHVFAVLAPLEGMFPLYAAKRFGWSTLEIGTFISLIAVVAATTQLAAVGRVAAQIGEAQTSLLGLVLACAGLYGLGVTQSVPWMMMSALMIAFGNGLWFPAFTALYSRTGAAAKEQGESMARSVAMAQTGRGIGIILGGWAHHQLGVGWEFQAAAIGGLIGIGILATGLPLLLRRDCTPADPATGGRDDQSGGTRTS